MRFKTIFSREATTKDRILGTISGIEDFDVAWPGSKWRCLKVKWDKNSPVATLYNISPWEIEPAKRSPVHISSDIEIKRTCRQRESQGEYQRENAEACLNNARKVLQLYHDDYKMQKTMSIANRKYLSAVDVLISISNGPSFSSVSSVADDVHKQALAALDIEMSNLAETFSSIKLWNTSHFENLNSSWHPPSTLTKLSSPLTLDELCLSSSSSEPVSLSSDSCGASSRESDLVSAEDCLILPNLISCFEEKKLDLINLKSVNIVTSIASRMIQAGYKERLRDTFTNLSRELIRKFHVLDFNSIFRCRLRVDEGDSCHGEDISLQYWNSALQFFTRVLVEMRRQLNEQNFGAFEELKGDYFTKIVEQSVLKILNVASMSAALDKLLEEVPLGLVECLTAVFLRIIHAVSTYKTVADAIPTLLELVSTECKESVFREAEAIQERVEEVVSRMLDTVTNVISSSVRPETEGADIHPVTRTVLKGIRLLFQHRQTLDLILARNFFQTIEGIHSKKSFSCLISNLMMHLESVLEHNSKLLAQRELQHIFLLNNLQFLLQRVQNIVAKEPIGYDWVVMYQKQIEHYLKEYIETWAPVCSHVEDDDGNHFSFLKPSRLQQFTTGFQSVYDIQRHWKVPDPHLRERLRVSIWKKIVPSYCEYLKKHRKDHKYIVITAKDLEDLLAELFEG